MSFTKVEKRQTVKSLVKMNTKGQLHFDLAIQRNEVWDNLRKSKLIHSIILGYPIPTIFVEDTGDKDLWFMDGKQRGTTIISFSDGSLVLHKDTPPITLEDGTEFKLAGKTIKELPEEVVDIINDYVLSIWQFRGMTDEEKEEMFLRLNGGVPLKQSELYRVRAGSKIMEFVVEIKSMWFWRKSVNISKSVKNRFGDEESIFQILYLLDNNGKAVGFGHDEINEFIDDIRFRGLEDDFKDAIRQITNYLAEAIPVKETFLKKVNIPMLYVLASKAIAQGVTPVKFGGWAQQFFADHSSADNDYSKACANGTGKVDNVRQRITIMSEHLDKNIGNANNYVNEKWNDKEKALYVQEMASREAASTKEDEPQGEGNSEQTDLPLVDREQTDHKDDTGKNGKTDVSVSEGVTA